MKKSAEMDYTGDKKAIIDLLVKIKREKILKLPNHYVLHINGLESKDKQFITSAKDLKFGNYKKLQINNSECFEADEIEDLNAFLDTSSPYCLRQFYLHGSLDDYPKIDKFMSGLSTMLKNITEVVFIDSFSITQANLK